MSGIESALDFEFLGEDRRVFPAFVSLVVCRPVRNLVETLLFIQCDRKFVGWPNFQEYFAYRRSASAKQHFIQQFLAITTRSILGVHTDIEYMGLARRHR